MIKSQYLISAGIVTFYDDKPFTISPYPDDGIDLFPNKDISAGEADMINDMARKVEQLPAETGDKLGSYKTDK
jgi:hypothetical protein